MLHLQYHFDRIPLENNNLMFTFVNKPEYTAEDLPTSISNSVGLKI